MRHILYPQCLAFLKMLLNSKFREAIAKDNNFMSTIEWQQNYHWSFYKQKILRNYDEVEVKQEEKKGEEAIELEEEEKEQVK